jgi:hypothetical protein
MILGAYWSPRRETEEAAASRVATFLREIGRIDTELGTWFPTGKSPSRARALAQLDAAAIRPYLRRIRTDTDRRAVEDLGWQVSLWNGHDTSLRATLGLFAAGQSNAVTLSFGSRATALSIGKQQEVLGVMIRTFDPDHAVATSSQALDAASARHPWEAGWIRYERGGDLRANGVTP